MIESNIELKKLAKTFNITVDRLIKDEWKFDITKINVLEILREQKEMMLSWIYITIKLNLHHNTQIILKEVK